MTKVGLSADPLPSGDLDNPTGWKLRRPRYGSPLISSSLMSVGMILLRDTYTLCTNTNIY